jgi:hypothetical protein
LPLGWWFGAGLLAAGNVVIGSREKAENPDGTTILDQTLREAQETEGLLGNEEEDLMELRESLDGERVVAPRAEQSRLKVVEDTDNPI